MIGKTISHYRITEKLGEGGMGEVYLAEDTELNRRVALKFLTESAGDDAEALARFKREAQAAAALNHPNIVTIHEIGHHEGRPYIAMSYIDGGTLRDEMQKGIARDRVLDVVIQACRGLEKAHEAGIVHRDIKPENLISDSDGIVKIVDFGIATLNEPRGGEDEFTTMGTTYYMSPEQAQGETMDARSDVFSLGAILYEMLSGRRPFTGEHTSAVHYSIVNKDPEPLSSVDPKADPRLEPILMKALAKNPDDRYQSAAELAADLEALRAGAGAGRPAPLKRFAFPVLAALVALVVFFVLDPFKDESTRDGGGPGQANVLAVMYFDNLAQRDDPGRLGEIVTDLLITKFSQSEDLKVVSSQRLYDILKQRGKEGTKVIDRSTATEVARAAKARWMMTGSIHRVSPNLIINVQLIDVATGNVEGSEQLEGEPGESVFALVDRMAGKARQELDDHIPLGVVQPGPVADVTTSSLDAYRHYVEGLDFEHKLYYADALESYREAIRLDSTFAMAHYRYAFAAVNSNNLAGALSALQQAARYIDRVSEKERLYIEAMIAMMRLRYEEADEKLMEVTRRYPDEKEAYYTLANLQFARGENERAIENYTKVLALDPFHKPSYNQLSYAYNRLGNFEKSLEAVNRYIDLSPGEANPLDTRGDLYAYNGDIENAIASYRKALEVKPDFLPSARKLGNMYLYKGEYEDAAGQYRALIASDEPSIRSTGRTYRAVIELYRGRLREGLEVLDAGLSGDDMEGFRGDSYFTKFFLRAGVYVELGDLQRAGAEAMGIMAAVKRTFPMLAVIFDLATASFVAEYGHPEMADSVLAPHEAAVDTFDRGTLGAYHVAKGMIALRSGDPGGAIGHFAVADSLAPDQYVIRYWLATAYLDANRVTDAVALLEKALRRYDDDRLADPAKAVKGMYLLGVACQRAGQTDKAIAQFRSFLEVWKDADPEFEEVADARRRLAELGAGL